MCDIAEKTERSQLIERAVRQYADMIFRLAFQHTGSYHDAEDILQEVAAAMVAYDAPLTEEPYLKNWLIKVTLNRCRNLNKRKKLRTTQPLDESIPAPEQEISEMTELLQKLPEKYRDVLYLHYYEQYTVDEIAALLDRSRNTVGSQLRRGREKLRTILTEGGYTDD